MDQVVGKKEVAKLEAKGTREENRKWDKERNPKEETDHRWQPCKVRRMWQRQEKETVPVRAQARGDQHSDCGAHERGHRAAEVDETSRTTGEDGDHSKPSKRGTIRSAAGRGSHALPTRS